MPQNGTDSMTGPWVLALGALGIGVAAIAAEIRRRRRGEDAEYHRTGDV